MFKRIFLIAGIILIGIVIFSLLSKQSLEDTVVANKEEYQYALVRYNFPVICLLSV